MATTSTTLATLDLSPFFEKAIRYGLAREIVTPARLQLIQEELAKGMAGYVAQRLPARAV